MRYVSITDNLIGCRLAQDLYDVHGRIVVAEDTELTNKILLRLQNYGFDGIYIKDEFSDDVHIEDLLSAELRAEGQEAVRNMDVTACMKVSEKICNVLMSKRPLHAIDMIDIRSFDDLVYAHTVNVSLICGVVGIAFDLDDTTLQNLVLAAMLHDFGKMKIPKSILNKPERLSRTEYELIKQHPHFSMDIINQKQPIPKEVEDAIIHHHENYDGTGYPDGIKGEEQSLITRILHVADVYDAMVSKRTFKDAYSVKDTVEYMMAGCGNLFDQDVVNKLLTYVPLYNKGTSVMLTNGMQGIVFENEGQHNLRPIIKLRNGKFLDLSDRENFTIGIVQTEGVKPVSVENERARMEMVGSMSHKPRILVVDDMKPNLLMLQGILEKDYQPILLKSGQQALDYFDKYENVDLIIMDINMPEMNGIETAKKIFDKLDRRIPLLFITELSDKSVIMQCLSLNVSGYIVRPYKPDFVLSEIKRIIG